MKLNIDMTAFGSSIRIKLFLVLIFCVLSSAAFSCTVVIAWDGEKVLVGNNEDWIKIDAKHWYEPADDESRYGAVFFGFKGDGKFAQGGMNDKGLFFDGLYIEKVQLEKSTRMGKKAAPQHVFKHMLHNAATVEEALQYLEPYFIPFIKNAQIVIADQNGDYAVLNVNGVTRRRLEKETHVLISNFPAEEIGHNTDWDPVYTKALEELEGTQNITSSLVTSTLNICHQEGKVKSVYSNVLDLTNRRIVNYYLYDFENPHVIDLEQNLNCDPGRTYLFQDIFRDRYNEIHSIGEEG